jgi:hypothetical protein
MQDLAKRHGWKPQGTVFDTDIQYQSRGGNLDDPEINQELWREAGNDVKSWPGSYATNDFQWVTEEDARNMADALERAVEELEEGDKEFIWVTKGNPGEEDKIDNVFSKRRVAEFAWFCRQGEFRIC